MGVTIKDVARLAGVSPSTVSRVLNQKNVISPKTTDRIRSAMRQLGYVPNDLARSFARASSNVIALAVDSSNAEDYSNRFFHQTVFALEAQAHRRGYRLMIVNLSREEKEQASILALIQGKRIDGLIIPEKLSADSLMERLQEEDFPFVLLGKHAASVPYPFVDIDNVQAGRLATAFLLELGYERLCFLTSDLEHLFAQDRLQGFRSEMESHDRTGEEIWVERGMRERADLERFVSQKLRGFQKRTGLLCGSDRIACWALYASKRQGIAIPGELGILSFDNTDLVEFLQPSISAVDVDTYAEGLEAAELLIDRIQNRQSHPRGILIASKIKVRETTSQ